MALAIIAIFAGTIGMAIGISNRIAYRKLIDHLRASGVIDERFETYPPRQAKK